MEKCFLQRSKFGPDDYSRVDIVTLKPAVFHLQDKMNVVVESDDGIGVLPFQMMNLPDHSVDESRFLLIGMTTTRRLVVVAHTDRGGRIRIINARRATRKERASYEKG